MNKFWVARRSMMKIYECFVTEDFITALGYSKHIVIRSFEEEPETGRLLAPYRTVVCLAYKMGVITLDPNPHGISCFLKKNYDAAYTIMCNLKENADRMVLAECEGYCLGVPPFEYKSSSNKKISVVVPALKPLRIVCRHPKASMEANNGK